MDISQIIERPLLTEKIMSLEANRVYGFRVNPQANKAQIKQAVEVYFKVKVAKVNVIRIKGKSKRTGRKRLLKQSSSWKKALVKLQPGEKIELLSAEVGKATKQTAKKLTDKQSQKPAKFDNKNDKKVKPGEK